MTDEQELEWWRYFATRIKTPIKPGDMVLHPIHLYAYCYHGEDEGEVLHEWDRHGGGHG